MYMRFLIFLCHDITRIRYNAHEHLRQKTYLLTYAPNEDSDQTAHPRSLIWVFVVRMKEVCIIDYPRYAQRRLTFLSYTEKSKVTPEWPRSQICTITHAWFQNVSWKQCQRWGMIFANMGEWKRRFFPRGSLYIYIYIYRSECSEYSLLHVTCLCIRRHKCPLSMKSCISDTKRDTRSKRFYILKECASQDKTDPAADKYTVKKIP